MGKRTITTLTVLAIILACLQYTPLQFLSKDATDFIWGMAAGFLIGTAVVWGTAPNKDL